MIWRFGKRQLNDVVKVQQFLEKEGIEFELLLDHVDLQVGQAPAQVAQLDEDEVDEPLTAANAPALKSGTRPIDTSQIEVDPLWRPAVHDNKGCTDRACKEIQHYGGEVML